MWKNFVRKCRFSSRDIIWSQYRSSLSEDPTFSLYFPNRDHFDYFRCLYFRAKWLCLYILVTESGRALSSPYLRRRILDKTILRHKRWYVSALAYPWFESVVYLGRKRNACTVLPSHQQQIANGILPGWCLLPFRRLQLQLNVSVLETLASAPRLALAGIS